MNLSNKISFDRGIASLRGLAVLMLVAFHSLDADSVVATGRVDSPFIGLLLGFVRVPLFAVVAGYLSGLRPIRGAHLGPFIGDRARRLLIPCVAVTTLMLALRWLVPGTSERLPAAALWTAYVYPYEHLWYLPALFWTSIILGLADTVGFLDTPFSSVATLCVVTGACSMISAPDLFSLVGVPLILPFVMLGFTLRRHEGVALSPRVLAVAGVVAVIGYGCLLAYWFFALDVNVNRSGLLYLVVGVATNLLLMRWRRPVPMLERVAEYAYPIYLFHLIGISVGARLARGFHVGRFASFVFELSFGIVVSVIAAKLAERHAWTRAIFLGSPDKKLARVTAPAAIANESPT